MRLNNGDSLDAAHIIEDGREDAILSAIFADPSGDTLDELAYLPADAMESPRAAAVLATCRRLRADGSPVDAVHVAEYVCRAGDAVEHLGAGWFDWLLSLSSGAATAMPDVYAREILDGWRKRRLQAVCRGIAGDPAAPFDELMARLQFACDDQHDVSIPALTSAELDAADVHQHYHVPGLIPASQPGIIGAPKKSLKTNISIDIVLSIADGSPALGYWHVEEPVPVALISGESGAATIQETARRVARSKRLQNLADYHNAYWSFDLPKLGTPRALSALRQFIKRHKLRVLILDPAYLALDIGDDAANLFRMGQLLAPLIALCTDLGVTIILVHHLVKAVGVTDAPPELENLAWAGFAEFARFWLLLSRRSKYNPDVAGHHELWLTAGGSAGHSVAKAIDIEEGHPADPGGRCWSVQVAAVGAAVAEKVNAAAIAKEERARSQHERAVSAASEKILQALGNNPGGLTIRRLKEDYGIRKNIISDAADRLLQAGTIFPCAIVAGNKQVYDGFSLFPPSPGTTGNDREHVPVVPDGSQSPRTGNGNTVPLIRGTVPAVCVGGNGEADVAVEGTPNRRKNAAKKARSA